jgi:1,4-dihydroxy-2-naphthoyl-CoA synthase
MTQVQWQSTNDQYTALKLEVATAEGQRGDVYRVLLNRPDALNALNGAMFEEIPKAVKEAEQAGARALIITGAGRAPALISCNQPRSSPDRQWTNSRSVHARPSFGCLIW